MAVRTRVLAAVLGVTAIGMLVAGVTSFLVQRERVDARIDDNLAQEVDELREFANTGIDPATGDEFTTVDRFLQVVMQRNVPDRNEGLLAFVDGVVAWEPATDVDVRLEDDEDFVDDVADQSGSTRVRPRSIETEELGQLRYVTVPVTDDDDDAQGLYVIAYSRDLEQAEVVDAYQTFAVVAIASLAMVGAVGWLVAGRLLRPIRLLRDTAQQISDTDLSGRIAVTGTDDISALARTFNDMLDRLEVAFAGQRDALDDAGHEMRTPITIIRGHLELMDSADPADVEEVRAMLLDELDRMHRMVDDLVMLAKAKRPDFVHPRPVELDRLVDEVLDKARALADRQWRVDARVSATVDLDPQRITQALLQLISNAVKHTEPGDVIAVGSQLTGAEARLWVRDTGIGIAADDIDRIFDRFARADVGRGVEGSGLGLAIVTAIAEAHRGTVTVDSRPGAGAVFTIALPLVGSAVTDDLVEEEA
ncbi:HAMP domain-containing histidine kinase [Jiangella ureilytica]|uniref:histidine kinase n=1 Tax=Jiangella ureilytica TaxID=2530374 RepID=A0A4R4R8Q8_9ACTN|nr:HAMP domain-containing sensor histidine kinase [Jiangella ureilytica]TDC45356.1 HAMP domain-containing histidine kinase [Jiangella ureilytica]